MPKCNKCLRGAKISVTGAVQNNTLKIDIGGAVVYVMPNINGNIDVTLNAQSLIDGDYAVSLWNGEQWIINTMKKR